MRRVYAFVLITLLAIVLPQNLGAQVNPQIDTARNEGPQVRGLEYHKEEPDSVKRGKVYYFFYTPAQTKINAVMHPSLSPAGAQFNDAIDAINGNYYLGVGVAGHPHLALYPTPDGERDSGTNHRKAERGGGSEKGSGNARHSSHQHTAHRGKGTA